jgi:hypothetical protein
MPSSHAARPAMPVGCGHAPIAGAGSSLWIRPGIAAYPSDLPQAELLAQATLLLLILLLPQTHFASTVKDRFGPIVERETIKM